MRRHYPLLALACASLLLASGASAQVPDRAGFFGAVDGRWTWLGGDLGGASQQSTSGPAGQALIGYKFSEWDVALAGDVQGLLTTITHFQGGLQLTDTTRQHVDVEAGYGGADWRMSLGLRGFHFFQHQNYAAPTLAAYYQRDVYGFGPKVGLGGRLPFRDPAWSVVGGANAALLLAQFTDSGNGQLGGSSYWMAVPQLDGEFGLNWRLPAPSAFSVTVGGRLAAWFNTSITFDGSYQTTWLEFGPFVRLAYNFGGRITPKSLAAPHVSPEATATANVVRFGFDETTIGPVATGVLRQAASDVSSGRPVNLSIRGMAEDGDTDHERRLAAQRAATVKEQLARLGVNERQIVLASRGEIPPLVAVPGVTAASTRVQIIY